MHKTAPWSPEPARASSRCPGTSCFLPACVLWPAANKRCIATACQGKWCVVGSMSDEGRRAKHGKNARKKMLCILTHIVPQNNAVRLQCTASPTDSTVARITQCDSTQEVRGTEGQETGWWKRSCKTRVLVTWSLAHTHSARLRSPTLSDRRAQCCHGQPPSQRTSWLPRHETHDVMKREGWQ